MQKAVMKVFLDCMCKNKHAILVSTHFEVGSPVIYLTTTFAEHGAFHYKQSKHQSTIAVL